MHPKGVANLRHQDACGTLFLAFVVSHSQHGCVDKTIDDYRVVTNTEAPQCW